MSNIICHMSVSLYFGDMAFHSQCADWHSNKLILLIRAQKSLLMLNWLVLAKKYIVQERGEYLQVDMAVACFTLHGAGAMRGNVISAANYDWQYRMIGIPYPAFDWAVGKRRKELQSNWRLGDSLNAANDALIHSKSFELPSMWSSVDKHGTRDNSKGHTF